MKFKKGLRTGIGIAAILLASLVSCKNKPIESPNSIKDIASIDHTILLSCDAQISPKGLEYLGYPKIEYSYYWDSKQQKWLTNDEYANAIIQIIDGNPLFTNKYGDVLGCINISYQKYNNHRHQVCKLIMVSQIDGMRSPFLPESLTKESLTRLYNYSLIRDGK